MQRTISTQLKRRAESKAPENKEFEGSDIFVSTGSTLLDLAISGGRVYGGGIPGGILVEIFGPSSAGKTVLLCEIAGNIQRAGGDVLFKDPEARLNKQFARIFDFNIDSDMVDYGTPNTVPEVFKSVRDWNPKTKAPIHGVIADSLAALSTEMEMEDKDAYGMRRAKEFSEECRKTCRILPERNILMVCSNQVRQNIGAGPYGIQFKSPGGEAIGFYSSLRLRCKGSKKIKDTQKIAKKDVSRIIGIETEIEVFKSSVWKPYREASIYILFDYGIDDVRANLQFVKQITGASTYVLREEKLGSSMEASIEKVEEDGMVEDLRKQTIELWNEVEARFEKERKPKHQSSSI